MSAFKPGDRVLIRAMVTDAVDEDGDHYLVTDASRRDGRRGFYARPTDLERAPEPPYVDPEMVPGMVVAPLDENETDEGLWHYLPDDAMDKVPFRTGLGWRSRDELPDRIRVVFDPREVTS